MRVPVIYSASELTNWHIAEEYESGKWRPARCCGFSGIRHLQTRIKIAWRVFTGVLDAVNWGSASGEPDNFERRRYKDCTEPEFFTATKVYEFHEGKQK